MLKNEFEKKINKETGKKNSSQQSRPVKLMV
jgi:hypothetical protein